MARGVLRVDDPPRAVAALAREVEAAVRVAVEVDSKCVDQETLDGARPFADELLDRGGIGHVVARVEYVPGEALRLRGGVVDDPPCAQSLFAESGSDSERSSTERPSFAAWSA